MLMKKIIHAAFMMLMLLVMTSAVSAEMVFTHVTPLNEDDHRHDYGLDLLRLSLEKTIDEFGPYSMVGAPKMNQARGMESVSKNRYTNLIRTFGYEERFERDLNMAYVKFPIHLGVVGYRVCFIPKDLQPELYKVKTSNQLLKFIHGQGRGWADVETLRHNGFKVIEIAEYESLFKMTGAGRIQLFCRGVNEVMDEHMRHLHVKGLALDKSMVIFYPLPRFFYTHRSNKKALERIELGLQRALDDGSLIELWEKSYRSSIDFVNLKGRSFFYFDSPLVDSIDFDYQKYFLSLQDEASL